MFARLTFRRAVRSSVVLHAAMLTGLIVLATPVAAQGPCDVELDPPPECFVVTVTPDGGSASRPFYSGVHTQTFVVRNTGQVADMYNLGCGGTINVTCTGTSVASISLFPGDSAQVSAFYSVGAPGSGTLTLTATGTTSTAGGPSDGGHYNITVFVPPGAPVVDATPFNSDNYVVGRCAASCVAAMHAQSTVPYFSLDAPRSVTLVYNGDRVNPKPFIHVNVSPDLGYGQTPDEYRLHALINGALVVFLNNEDTLRFAYAGSAPVRIGGQLDASSYATGAYDLEIRVAAKYTAGLIENVIKTRLLVVNGTTSSVARGWTVGGVQRLFVDADSALVVDGDGSAIYFRKSGASFLTPPGDFSQLVAGIPGGGSGWTRRYPDSTKIVFNSMGRMVEVRDRFNSVTTIVHSVNGDTVKQVKDPLNLAISLSYDGNGLDAITDPMGRVTQVTVDASKRLTLIQDPDGIATSFGYDGSMRLLTVTNRGGRTTTLGYDAQSGKLATVTAPTITYVGSNGADSTGAPVTTFAAWQKGGVPYSGTGTPFTPIPVDSAYAVLTDAGGHATRFTVNRWGTPVWTRDQGGNVTTVTFDANGLSIRVVQPTGAKDSAVYNANGLPTYHRSNQDPAVSIAYGAWAQAINIQQTGQPAVVNWLGANGRIDSTSVGGLKTKYRYDVRGRPDSVVDAENHLIQRTWYAGTRGNRSKDSLPGARVTTYGYDTYGRPTTITPPGGPTVTTYYSIVNRTDSIRDGVNPVATRYGYDSLHLRTVTDPKGQQYGFSYNALGWLTQRIDPVGAAEVYAYSSDGLPRRYTNRRGDSVQTAYDTLHRPVLKFGENTDTASWSYASNGLAMTATSPVAVITHALRMDGRLDSLRTQMAGQTYKVRYTYTAAGLLDSVVPSGGGLTWQVRNYRYHSTKFTLDSIRLGTLLTQTATNHVGQLTTVTLPGGDVVDRRTTSVHSTADITTAASYEPTVTRYMGYNVKGQLFRHIFSDGLTGKEYVYDGLGRLKEDWWIHYDGPQNICDGQDLGPDGNLCTEPPTGWFQDSSVTFAYDSVGNRRDKGGQYTTGNRITNFDSCTYQTDADGNVTQRTCGADTVRFVWTAESRLRQLIEGGDTIHFDYDAGGALVRKRVNGAVVRHFLWHGDELLAELNAAGTGKVAEYSYYPGLDNPHALIVGTTAYFAHRDAVGNVIALTDTAKQVRRTYDFDAWGNSTGGTDYAGLAGADRARFKGALWLGEGTELYYMRARWYEPKTGRFLSEDAVGLLSGLNQVIFAADDPVNNADPTGLWCEIQEKWVEGEVSSGVVEVLVCTDLGPGDWETIRDYLNSGAPGAGDSFYGLVGSLGSAWSVGFARNCAGGHSSSQCGVFGDALSRLIRHGDPICRQLGSRASRRFQRGRIRPIGPIQGVWGVAVPWYGAILAQQGIHSLTLITQNFWAEAQIHPIGMLRSAAYIMSHEEAHHMMAPLSHPANNAYLSAGNNPCAL